MNGNQTQTGVETEAKAPLRQRLKKLACDNLLVILLIFALVFGIGMGFILRLRPEPYTTREKLNLGFPGEILMHMLTVMILPLTASSLIVGMTSLNLKSTGKLGVRAFSYYIITTFLAVILGIILVLSIKPGESDRPHQVSSSVSEAEMSDTLMDLVRQLFPSNMIEMAFQRRLTRLKNNTLSPSVWVMEPYITSVPGMNMLGIITLSLCFSIAINVMGPKGEPLKIITNSVLELSLVVIGWIIWYSPLGVFFLVTKEIVVMRNPVQMFRDLAFYFITVMLGLAIHGFIVLPGLYTAITRSNPYKFMKGMLQALVTALGTGSSLATLPITMKNLEDNNKVDPRIVGFVAPVGATINMDGTALYEAVAVIFIAQVESKILTIAEVIIICFTATVAAIGAAGIPQAGLVTMVIVLAATGLPKEKIGLILSIDWLLDRFRTAVNVWGDAIGCGIIQHLCRSDILLQKPSSEPIEMSFSSRKPDDQSPGASGASQQHAPETYTQAEMAQTSQHSEAPIPPAPMPSDPILPPPPPPEEVEKTPEAMV